MSNYADPSFYTDLSAEKLSFVAGLLETEPVLVFIDPNRSGVQVPEMLRDSEWLCFGVYRGEGLRVDEAGISGTVAIDGVPHDLSIPWEGVLAAHGEGGLVAAWLESDATSIFTAHEGVLN